MDRIIWHERVLGAEPSLGDDGSFELEGTRYASLAVCARQLDVNETELRRARLQTLPKVESDGFAYISDDEPRVTYLRWQRAVFFPVERIRDVAAAFGVATKRKRGGEARLRRSP